MDKKPLESKKFIAFIICSISIIGCFLIGYFSMLYAKDINIGELINLCTSYIVTIGGVTATYTSTQAIIDFKANVVNNLKEDSINIGNKKKNE